MYDDGELRQVQFQLGGWDGYHRSIIAAAETEYRIQRTGSDWVRDDGLKGTANIERHSSGMMLLWIPHVGGLIPKKMHINKQNTKDLSFPSGDGGGGMLCCCYYYSDFLHFYIWMHHSTRLSLNFAHPSRKYELLLSKGKGTHHADMARIGWSNFAYNPPLSAVVNTLLRGVQ